MLNLLAGAIRPLFTIAAIGLALPTLGTGASAASTRPLVSTMTRSVAPAALGQSAPAAAMAFKTIDNPGDPTFNQLLGIDNDGVISGYFGMGSKGHPNKGYTIAPPYTAFVPDNLPTSKQTQATGIVNGGTTTGFWSPTNLGGGDANYGFIRLVERNGANLFLDVNNPLAGGPAPVNQVLGINSSLIAVGFYNDAGGNSHGYVYNVNTGLFIPVKVQTANFNAATGINSVNVICGFFVNPNGTTKGFVQLPNFGGEIHYGFPGSKFTQFLGINTANIAVGFYNDINNIPHGIVYNAKTNAVQVVNGPNAVGGTVLNGINDKNQIVGFYTDVNGHTHGLLTSL